MSIHIQTLKEEIASLTKKIKQLESNQTDAILTLKSQLQLIENLKENHQQYLEDREVCEQALATNSDESKQIISALKKCDSAVAALKQLFSARADKIGQAILYPQAEENEAMQQRMRIELQEEEAQAIEECEAEREILLQTLEQVKCKSDELQCNLERLQRQTDFRVDIYNKKLFDANKAADLRAQEIDDLDQLLLSLTTKLKNLNDALAAAEKQQSQRSDSINTDITLEVQQTTIGKMEGKFERTEYKREVPEEQVESFETMVRTKLSKVKLQFQEGEMAVIREMIDSFQSEGTNSSVLRQPVIWQQKITRTNNLSSIQATRHIREIVTAIRAADEDIRNTQSGYHLS